MEQKEENRFINGNIPLVINSYIDIFSSFDSRPFSSKSLSDDFLNECKKAARDKSDMGLELIISVPKEKRNINDEFKIKKRLKEHFKKHFLQKQEEIRKIKLEGWMWVGFGIILFLAVFLGLLRLETSPYKSLLTIFEIPSWFLVWEGMGKIFLDTRKIEPDYNFYRKMSEVYIIFYSH